MNHGSPARFILATVALGRSSVKDDVGQIVIDELRGRNVTLVRSLTVNRERHFIEQLVKNIAGGNEADVVILIGGVGLGLRDYTCEAVDGLADRRIEGFGEAFRQMMRDELKVGVRAFLARATAGICNRCLFVALPREPDPLRLAIRDLVLPTVADALRRASSAPPVV